MPTLNKKTGQVEFQGGEALPVVGSTDYENLSKGIIPKALPISTASSSNGSKIIDTHIAEHNQDMETSKNVSSPVVTEPTKKPTTKRNTAVEDIGGITADEAQTSGIDLTDYSYDSNSGYYVPKSSTAEGLIDDRYKKEEDEINSTFGDITKGWDQTTQNLMSSYKNLYAERIADQRISNSEAERSARASNIRTGVARYAPNQARNILSSVETAGLKKIKDLSLEEATLLSQAQQSLQDKKYTAFVAKRNEIKELRNKRLTEISKLNEEARKQRDEQIKKQRQATRDAAVADLVKQGVKDPADMLDLLNYDESGKLVGDFTADEIDKVLKVVSPDASLEHLDSDYRTYKYLKDIGDPAVKGLGYMDYVKAISNAKRKPEDTESNDISLTADKKTKLLGAGFNQNDITNIEKDVREHGIDKVLEGISDEKQKKALKEVYGGSTGDNITLDRANIAKLYNIADDDTQEHSFLGIDWGQTGKEKLDNIMNVIERYRAVGYSDKEILKIINSAKE